METNAQLRPGGLAYLTGLTDDQAVNNGTVVTTVRRFTHPALPVDTEFWKCVTRTPVVASEIGILSTRPVMSDEFVVPARFLRPIGGVDVTDDVDTDVTLDDKVPA